MTKAQMIEDAGEVLNRSAVTFDTDRRFNNQRAWPFFYPFIPKPYLETDVLNNGLGLLGITIPAGATKDITVALDRDSVYRMLNVKYTVYRCALGEAIEGETLTTEIGSTTVLCTDTELLIVGRSYAWLDNNGDIKYGTIASITDATHFVLEQAATSVATASAMFLANFLWYDTPPAQDREAHANLTGTITIAPGTNALTGVGTNFDPELAVGDVFVVNDANGIPRQFMLATRTNDTTGTVTETLAASDPGVAGATFFKIADSLTGTITVNATTRVATGVGTTYLTQLQTGNLIFYPDASGVVQAMPVSNIISATILNSTQPTVVASGAGVTFALGIMAVDPEAVGYNLNPPDLYVYRPLTQYLRVSIVMPSLRGRYLYGGTQVFFTPIVSAQGMQERPLLISALQGINDGLGMLRTSMVFAWASNVKMRVTNLYSQDVLVNGTLFGYKISGDE